MDIQSRDLDVKWEKALETFLQHHCDHWLWQRLLMIDSAIAVARIGRSFGNG